MRSLSSVIGPNVILQFDHLSEWSFKNFNKKCVLQSFARVDQFPEKRKVPLSVIMTLLTNIWIIPGITIMIFDHCRFKHHDYYRCLMKTNLLFSAPRVTIIVGNTVTFEVNVVQIY